MDNSKRLSDLAIFGGPKVRATPMPPRVALGTAEIAMIKECLEYYSHLQQDPGYGGRFSNEYSRQFQAHMSGGYATPVATGTGAVFVAIAALGLAPGSEVLVSPITDPGTLSAILLNRCVPRLMDSAPSSFNVSVESFLSRITPSTKAVLIVHSIGEAADAKNISHEAKRRDIAVIEDCSQAHGALLDGRPVGSYGDVAAFSTMYRKAHVTGGCGGVVWTCNPELNKAIIAHSDRGKPKWERSFDDRNPNTFLVPALNWNLDELSCAIGIASLQRLTDTINTRRIFVARLTDRLRKNSKSCMPYPIAGSESPFVFPVIINSHRLTCNKSDFAQALIAEGIPLNPDYKYVACEWPWLKPFLSDDFNTCNAVDIRNKSICLYLNENYSTKECEDIFSAIRKLEYAYGE